MALAIYVAEGDLVGHQCGAGLGPESVRCPSAVESQAGKLVVGKWGSTLIESGEGGIE